MGLARRRTRWRGCEQAARTLRTNLLSMLGLIQKSAKRSRRDRGVVVDTVRGSRHMTVAELARSVIFGRTRCPPDLPRI